MKPIIINMSEMSDSREVYDSKPNRFFSIFIYTILLIIIITIVWAKFGKIDIVVKSEAMIRPNSQVSTVMNKIAGNLDKVNIADGDQINKGDTIFVINHDDIDTQLNLYQDKKSTIENNISLLKKYKKSIEKEKNLLSRKGDEEKYYYKYIAYMLHIKSLKHSTSYGEDERTASLDSVQKQITDNENEISYLKRLKQAVENGKNTFRKDGDEQSYYNQFVKYNYDYDSLKKTYMDEEQKINLQTNEDSIISSNDYYTNVQKQLQKLKKSIDKGKNLFKEDNIYSSQYVQYCNKVKELTATYDQAKSNYETNEELSGLSVTEWEVDKAYNDMTTASLNLTNFKLEFMENLDTNLRDTKTKLDDLKLQKGSTLTKKELLKQNKEKSKTALASFKTNFMVEIDTKIDSIKTNLDTLYANKDSLDLKEKETLYVNDEDANLVSYKNDELQDITESISALNDQLDEVEASIDSYQNKLNDCFVKAKISGKVNSNVELVKGDYLDSGVQVLSIIPGESSMYKAYIYVSNKDIGKLVVDMKVKFNVYAYPNTDYGYLTGKITKISEDLKIDANNSSSYYLVEAALDSVEMIDDNGNSAQLKPGMACNAKIITERESILKFVLDKLDLWLFN